MDRHLADFLNRPLRIGDRWIPGRLVLAPMTDLGHVAFRHLLAEFGGYGLLWSEMVDARRLPTENPAVSNCFRWREAEKEHLVFQIVGHDPQQMAMAARRIQAEGFFGVDINFGCSVQAICKKGAGAALLREPSRAEAVVAAVRRAVDCPVLVKYRTGWQDDPQLAVALARRFEAAGADALTFHPRVAPDRRTRPPRWSYIAAVKQAVTIPVFGNGNVFSAAACQRMIEVTGCDGVAVGRMAIARPWLFAEWTGRLTPAPGIYRRSALRLIDLLKCHFEPGRAVVRFRRFARYFAANLRFGHSLCRRLATAKDLDAAAETVEAFFDASPELTESPNPNFFH
ncbi:MAG TPA: tRNA-dihydrouridine synthase family protein [Desulfobacteraceae bacterium]|nr:tRNA-dihydrouridine synthase family protein [Deltaproteobacteria bacterium]RLB94733.1 MAG: tRNA-dihydrouridine synthase family protein [Deltaproteobacteria bacterium]HDI59998.1 tRNA-dihydrouridine synthase family protein [Desulfobacteraceae bacterium]